MKSTKKLNKEIFVERSILKHDDFYDYSKSIYVNANTKVVIICPKHGEFEQKPADHMNGRGCPQCGFYKNTRILSQEEILNRFHDRHGKKYDYSKVLYVNANTKVSILCLKHGEFSQTPHAHYSGSGCPKCADLKIKNVLMGTKDEFIEKAKKIHGDKYDYSKVEYEGNKEKVKIICPMHGEFFQKPNAHLNNSGCKKCGVIKRGESRSMTTEEYIKKAKKIHGNEYDYIDTIYHRSFDKIKIKCKKHGYFYQTPNNHLQGVRCPKCSAHISSSEIEISKILNSLNVSYIQHDRNILDTYELDFILPNEKIAIEFNGIFYHSENNGNKDKKYHLNKTQLCEESGYRLIHIFENEFLYNYNLLKFKLRAILGKNKYKIFARKCEIREISPNIKKKFNEKYHIQGDSVSCINLGLFYRNRLVQVMTFSKRRIALGSKTKEGEYELSRLSSMKGFTIIGGASKLLKHFEKNYFPKKLISYADRRWSNGKVYKKMGFEFIKNTPPNYWYFYVKKMNKPLYHRYKFAKHTLKNKLEAFDPTLTEWENMQNNNYDRIWDCGSMLFEKDYSPNL